MGVATSLETWEADGVTSAQGDGRRNLEICKWDNRPRDLGVVRHCRYDIHQRVWRRTFYRALRALRRTQHHPLTRATCPFGETIPFLIHLFEGFVHPLPYFNSYPLVVELTVREGKFFTRRLEISRLDAKGSCSELQTPLGGDLALPCDL